MNGFVDKEVARQASENVYQGKQAKQLPAGFEIDTSFANQGELAADNGVYMYALKPSATNTSVPANTRILAMRGTEPKNPTDIYADIADVGHGQFSVAQPKVNDWLANNIKAGNQIEVTGHSLGGALVQWTINDRNLQAINQTRTKDGKPGPDPEQIKSHLHFTTFNAPGIAQSPSSTSADRTSAIAGEHHVIAYERKLGALLPSGDPVHLLGGAQVGGSVRAHSPNYTGQGFLEEHAAHSISNSNGNWNAPVLANYRAPAIDASDYQAFIKTAMEKLGQSDQPTSETDAAAKVALSLYLASEKLKYDVSRAVVVDLPVQVFHTTAEYGNKAIQTGIQLGHKAADLSAYAYTTGVSAARDYSDKAVNYASQTLKLGTEKIVQTGHQLTDAVQSKTQQVLDYSQKSMNSAAHSIKLGAHKLADQGEKLLKETGDSLHQGAKKLANYGSHALEQGSQTIKYAGHVISATGSKAYQSLANSTEHSLKLASEYSTKALHAGGEALRSGGKAALEAGQHGIDKISQLGKQTSNAIGKTLQDWGLLAMPASPSSRLVEHTPAKTAQQTIMKP